MDKETWLILLSTVLVAVGIITVSTLFYYAKDWPSPLAWKYY